MSNCRSCGARIKWLATKGEKMMPIDRETWDDGEEIYDAKRGHISHFATCPHANTHRRSRE